MVDTELSEESSQSLVRKPRASFGLKTNENGIIMVLRRRTEANLLKLSQECNSER